LRHNLGGKNNRILKKQYRKMKKTIVLSLAVLTAAGLNAQSLKMEKGKLYKLEVKADMEANVGVPLNMKSENYTDVTVINEDDKNYTLILKKSRIVFNQSVMGQDVNFDTDSKEEQEGLENFKKELTFVDTFLVDKKTGKETKISKTIEDAEISDPLGALAKQGSDLSEFFLVIPQGKKVGDTWTAEISKDSNKATKTYT
jgi:hypothetical protein